MQVFVLPSEMWRVIPVDNYNDSWGGAAVRFAVSVMRVGSMLGWCLAPLPPALVAPARKGMTPQCGRRAWSICAIEGECGKERCDNSAPAHGATRRSQRGFIV